MNTIEILMCAHDTNPLDVQQIARFRKKIRNNLDDDLRTIFGMLKKKYSWIDEVVEELDIAPHILWLMDYSGEEFELLKLKYGQNIEQNMDDEEDDEDDIKTETNDDDDDEDF